MVALQWTARLGHWEIVEAIIKELILYSRSIYVPLHMLIQKKIGIPGIVISQGVIHKC